MHVLSALLDAIMCVASRDRPGLVQCGDGMKRFSGQQRPRHENLSNFVGEMNALFEELLAYA